MRRARLAMFLCAAPLLAAPAQASAGVLEREALREALRQRAQSAGRHVVPLPLPLPDRPHASAAAASGELARIASSDSPERLLIGLRSHSDRDAVAAELRALGTEPDSFELTGVLAARVPSAAAAVAALRDDPRVAYIERDRELSAAADEFDTIDPGTRIKFTWAYDSVRAGEAIAAVDGGSARTVSVLDTGLDVNHPEFVGRVQRTFDMLSGSANVTDFFGHGTFVTGLIAALDGNGVGGKGVAGTTKVLAVRASTDGLFAESDLIGGIEYSIRRGADVINMSLATPLQGFTESFARALEAAFFNDVLPVAASGNNAENGNPLEFPAAAVGGRRGGHGIGLSVAATRPDGTVASFSNHNSFVSLAAPGASQGSCDFGVFSTLPSSTTPPWNEDGCPEVFTGIGGAHYAYGEGTSFAAPIVSGLAALAWQAEHGLASEQVADVMVRAAAGSGWNEFTGAGVADGMRAVEIARVYDVVSPRARGVIRRHGNRVRVTLRRSRDRTQPGDELAAHVTYGLLVSRNGGNSFTVLASRRRRPFRRTVTLRGRRQNVIVSTACDRNGNCGVKRLGRFRRR